MVRATILTRACPSRTSTAAFQVVSGILFATFRHKLVRAWISNYVANYRNGFIPVIPQNPINLRRDAWRQTSLPGGHCS